jgi:hypothetical protein
MAVQGKRGSPRRTLARHPVKRHAKLLATLRAKLLTTPRSSANESACAAEKSLFDHSRQPTPLTQAQSEYSGLSRQA